MLETGLSHTSTLTVCSEKTAEVVGSGDMPVLATPAMMALMENAAMLAVAPHLAAGQTTVGGNISSSHLKPSPIGATVSATAILNRIEGKKLYFDVKAEMDGEVIGEGSHLRFIVDREKFLSKI